MSVTIDRLFQLANEVSTSTISIEEINNRLVPLGVEPFTGQYDVESIVIYIMTAVVQKATTVVTSRNGIMSIESLDIISAQTEYIRQASDMIRQTIRDHASPLLKLKYQVEDALQHWNEVRAECGYIDHEFACLILERIGTSIVSHDDNVGVSDYSVLVLCQLVSHVIGQIVVEREATDTVERMLDCFNMQTELIEMINDEMKVAGCDL